MTRQVGGGFSGPTSHAGARPVPLFPPQPRPAARLEELAVQTASSSVGVASETPQGKPVSLSLTVDAAR